ncbi:MAG: mycothiol conjugate amidase Mca [Propionibacteriaceae bacterium]|jgi:mycothiol S-conjugate amidase|nr:mycothiol conjugate amidase Mca [Propionibacteriaceae bacterium]
MSVPQRVDAEGQPWRLLFTHAHPDDESSKGAATMAKYVAEGCQVMVVTMTGGERGDILNPALNTPANRARLPELRRQEMERARAILGVEQTWLGYEDSGFFQGEPWPPTPPGTLAATPVDEAAARLVPILRQFRPHVIVTYDERGGYPHPDHIMCHRVTMAALAPTADQAVQPEAGPAWTVPKVYYYMGFHRARFAKLDAMMHEAGLTSPYAERLRQWQAPDIVDRLTTFVPCAEYFPIRDEALRAHATQIDPAGHWFAVPLAIEQKGWPTEDYELVSTTVETTIPEDDLLDGLATDAPALDSTDNWQI